MEAWLERANLHRVHGLLPALLAAAPSLHALKGLSSEAANSAISAVGLKPKGIKYKTLMSELEKLRESSS